MSLAKIKREGKRQLGQFLTPYPIAKAIVDGIPLSADAVVLEPSFGEGAFIFAYMDRLASAGIDVAEWAKKHLYGCEIDKNTFKVFQQKWRYGIIPETVSRCDFFRYEMPSFFVAEYFQRIQPRYDLIIGNPPFGGTIDPDIQDELDGIFGFRNGCKIKKETYAFFIVKCLDLLKPGGRLVFICSDTLLSINTMSGLRKYLMATCSVDVSHLPGEFSETKQPMIVLSLVKGERGVCVFGDKKSAEQIARTANYSWTITHEFAPYFTGITLGDYMTASSGMTVGKNEYFLRDIVDGHIVEPYSFHLYQRPITLEREIAKARLGKLSPGKKRSISDQEARGATETALEVLPRKVPLTLDFPNPDYAPYNKASSAVIYSPPSCAIYWKDDGEAVYAFRKSGPWYLHGVGGKPFFRKEGLTWQLISSHFNIRYLPPGYILDSGAPCAFLKQNIPYDELFFIMGWCLTRQCNKILKKVINHTRNIQSKDFERLPYPIWVSPVQKNQAIDRVKRLVDAAMAGEAYTFDSREVRALDDFYSLTDHVTQVEPLRRKSKVQMTFAFA